MQNDFDFFSMHGYDLVFHKPHFKPDKTMNSSTLSSYDEMPSRLDMAISLFTNKASSDTIGAVRAYSIRVPLLEDATIKALHMYSGQTQNKVIVQLLQVALDEVFQGMPESDRVAIFAMRAALLHETAFELEQPQALPGEV